MYGKIYLTQITQIYIVEQNLLNTDYTDYTDYLYGKNLSSIDYGYVYSEKSICVICVICV